MTERKYKVKVLTWVNCSSSMNYTFYVSSNHGSLHYSDGYFFRKGKRGEWLVWNNPPHYLEVEIQRQIAEMHRAGEFKVFEYDRDGNERKTDLRYHESEHFASVCGKRSAAPGAGDGGAE
jgi:hypothetical protein